MKQLTKKVFYCEHCNKHMLNSGAMSRHEKWCDSNPDNFKACNYCAHLKETEVTYTLNEGTEAEHERSSKAFRCDKLDKMLYPLIVERKGLNKKYSVFDEQEPMPKTCEHYKNELDELFPL